MNDQENAVTRKKNLKILVEDYLERDYEELKKVFDGHREEELYIFKNIFQLLCHPADDEDDLTADELRDAILVWRLILGPVWEKIKSAFIDYQKNVLPEREKNQKMISAANDPSSPLAGYKEIIMGGGYTFPSEEKTYAIKLRRSPIIFNLSFDSDKFSISMEGIRVIDSFLLQIKDAPTDIFSICGYCGKVIIITRLGKGYHAGCASKAKQKELWTKDPEGCREKERRRYRERLKDKVTSLGKPT